MKVQRKTPAQPDEVPKTEDVRAKIAIAAYYRAERRGFVPGNDLDDWLAAEAEVKTSAPAKGNPQSPRNPETAWTKSN